MTDLLVKLFVKDYEQTENLQVRTRYGLLSGMVGICCNVIPRIFRYHSWLQIRKVTIYQDRKR